MITVNLLPFEFRPIKRTPVPYLASGAVFALTLSIILIVAITNLAEVASANRKLEKHKADLANLKPIVEEYNSISAKKLKLAERVQTINAIVSDRILWSRQLFNLNRLALENMWYDGIQVSLKSFTESKNMYNPKTKTVEPTTVKIDRRVLTLSGFVTPGKDGTASVSPFTLATEGDPEFSKLFQLDLSTFKDTMFEEVGVRSFKLEYVVRDGESKS